MPVGRQISTAIRMKNGTTILYSVGTKAMRLGISMKSGSSGFNGRSSTDQLNTAKVSDEEVKYTTDAEGYIRELSKTVAGGLGEAVGINYVSRDGKAALVRQLARVNDEDYFERGVELAIEEDRLRVEPLDISDLYAVEIDFAEDLERANLFV